MVLKPFLTVNNLSSRTFFVVATWFMQHLQISSHLKILQQLWLKLFLNLGHLNGCMYIEYTHKLLYCPFCCDLGEIEVAFSCRVIGRTGLWLYNTVQILSLFYL